MISQKPKTKQNRRKRINRKKKKKKNRKSIERFKKAYMWVRAFGSPKP